MRKLPNGVSNYEDIIGEDRIYVDKTMYIEKLENLSDKTLMFLRPRKFGKTLFTSMLENYYDKLKEDKFEKLFGKTYIGKNPTVNKNRYCILRFNFSGIDTSTMETTINGFKREVAGSIDVFIKKYNLDFYINEDSSAEDILDNLFKAFYIQKANEKIYVIIDEYDHFANELLGLRTDDFKALMSRDGKIRKWYEILKKGTETAVDRIFITGVAPITLDSTTSGFNIARDLTKNISFNDMLGFSKEDVKYIMRELEISEEKQDELLPIIKQNYDGYLFSDTVQNNIEEYRMYNSNMTIYFLNEYIEANQVPQKFTDINIISDYSKIEGYMNLCKTMGKQEILEKIVAGDFVESEITEKFNSEMEFGEKELISLLFYLGYLTIEKNELGTLYFGVPNDVIRKIYNEYYLTYLKRLAGVNEEIKLGEMSKEILLEGKIDKAIEILGKFLTNLSNRDYQKFDEKYVKVIFYSIVKMINAVFVKSEQEVGGKYSDVLIIPREKKEERYGVLVEFKYIKQEDYDKDNSILELKQEEAKKQLEIYKNTEDIKLLPNVKCYSVVAIKDRLEVKEV